MLLPRGSRPVWTPPPTPRGSWVLGLSLLPGAPGDTKAPSPVRLGRGGHFLALRRWLNEAQLALRKKSGARREVGCNPCFAGES